MSNEDRFLSEMFSFENYCIKESYFVISYFGCGRGLFGMEFVSFFNKKLGLFCYSPKERKHHQWNVPLVFMLDWVCFSLCLVHICKGHCLCPMQLPGFEDNCFNWTQISFLSLRMRPSISWVGPGYNYTESSSSHQCVCILSCHLICSNYFFICCNYFLFCRNYFLFAATFLFAACPLWATILNRGKRKSLRGKLHLWSNPVRKHLQKHKP